MITFKKHRFTAIRHNGATRVWDDAGWPEVYRDMYSEMQSAGSTYSKYNMLLCDGKMLIQENVSDAAYRYCCELDEEISAIRDFHARKHWPVLLEDPKETPSIG